MKKDMPKAQAKVSSIVYSSKKVAIRGLGFCIFIIGAAFIISSYLGTPLIGRVIEGSFTSTASVAGLILEVIGITLMVIKIEDKKKIIDNLEKN